MKIFPIPDSPAGASIRSFARLAPLVLARRLFELEWNSSASSRRFYRLSFRRS
jgi:hypothetical protein